MVGSNWIRFTEHRPIKHQRNDNSHNKTAKIGAKIYNYIHRLCTKLYISLSLVIMPQYGAVLLEREAQGDLVFPARTLANYNAPYGDGITWRRVEVSLEFLKEW